MVPSCYWDYNREEEKMKISSVMGPSLAILIACDSQVTPRLNDQVDIPCQERAKLTLDEFKAYSQAGHLTKVDELQKEFEVQGLSFEWKRYGHSTSDCRHRQVDPDELVLFVYAEYDDVSGTKSDYVIVTDDGAFDHVEKRTSRVAPGFLD